MIAALPMYLTPQTAQAHAVLWALIRDGLRGRGIAAPDALDTQADCAEGWGRPDLVLGQICNLPYRALFRDRVSVIGASDYGLPDVPPGHYNSVWIVRAGDAARAVTDCTGYRFVLSDPLSQSGWGAAAADAARRGLVLCPVGATGSHAASIAAVAQGDADLATIDAVTWRHARRWNPAAAALRVIGHTGSSPGMSFVTAAATGKTTAPYFNAIASAIARLPRSHRATLGLRGIVALPAQAYALPQPPDPGAKKA